MWWSFGRGLKISRPAKAKVKAKVAAVEALLVGDRQVPLLMVRHARARRYLLRLQPDGSARVTIPRGGTQAEARRFAERNHTWLEQQFQRRQSQPQQPVAWRTGSQIWFRGELMEIRALDGGRIQFGDEVLSVPDVNADDLRPVIERHLRLLAARELPARVMEFAAQYQIAVSRVTVRNQKSRWGSCSRRGTISLNWRLVQTPVMVRDYIIRHELAHRRHMNHSKAFWLEVERLDPEWRVAEGWLKARSRRMKGEF